MKPGLHAWLEAAALAALLLLAAGYFAQPVGDVDFWWHAASGGHIVASGAVPATDPFGMYDAGNYWAQTVLRGQWLGQVAIHAAFAAGGFEGVIALRTALLLGCLALVWARARHDARGVFALFAVLFLGMMVLRGHLGERPQLFSFVFFAALLYVLDAAGRQGRARWLYALPPLFLVWANTHPGVILGAVVLSAWLALGLLEAWYRRLAWPAWRLPAAVCAAAWLATLATPNGVVSYEYLLRLEASPLKDRVSEYQSPLELAAQLQLAPSLPWYFVLALLALGAIGLLAARRRLRDAGLAALLLVLSLSAYRYIPFFVLFAVPLVAAAIGEMLDAPPRWDAAGTLAAALLSLALFAYSAGAGTLFRGGMASGHYPVELVEHMRAAKLSGRVFNTLNWGGYLGWALGRAVTPFMDGRLMEPERVRPYTHVLWMTREGRDYFEEARFDLVLIPHRSAFDVERTEYPLVGYLLEHPDWRLARSDAKGLLFVRRAAG